MLFGAYKPFTICMKYNRNHSKPFSCQIKIYMQNPNLKGSEKGFVADQSFFQHWPVGKNHGSMVDPNPTCRTLTFIRMRCNCKRTPIDKHISKRDLVMVLMHVLMPCLQANKERSFVCKENNGKEACLLLLLFTCFPCGFQAWFVYKKNSK